jgi:hypothetical protein
VLGSDPRPKSKFVINRKSAKMLGLAVPDTDILSTADEVIE